MVIEELECRRLLSFNSLDPTLSKGSEVGLPAALVDNVLLRTTGFAVLPNGNTVASFVEQFYNPVLNFRGYGQTVKEFNPAGVLVASAPGQSTGFDFFYTSITLLANGDILAAGGGSFAQEYTADLKPVRAVVDLGRTFLVAQSDGKMVLVQDGAIVRVKRDGTIDPTFNGGRPIQVDFRPQTAAIQPDGKIVIAGGGTTVNGVSAFEVLRLNPNGSFDQSFRGTGIERAALGFASDGVQAVAFEPDGQILVSGVTQTQLEVVRLTPDGHYDPTFATGGRLPLPNFHDSNANDYAVLVVGGGRIIIAESGLGGGAEVSRFLLDGQPDTGFNDGSPLPAGQGGGVIAAALAPDGQIAVLGGDEVLRIPQTPPAPSTGTSNAVFSGTVWAASVSNTLTPFRGAVVYVDLNQNGKLDPGEPKSVTDAAGHYEFSLAPGTYHVAVALGYGMTQLQPTALYYNVTLVPGALATYGDFSLAGAGTISGHVFVDQNGDGKFEPSENPAIALVYLDLNHDGKYDAGDYNVFVPGSGPYGIANLPPGVYEIRVANPRVGYRLKGLTAHKVRIGPNFTVTGIDFAVTAIGDVLTGVVFDDRNNNGVQDPGEPPLPGWQIIAHAVTPSQTNPFAVVYGTTDPSGRYWITLTHGIAYSVGVIQPGTGDTIPLGPHTVNAAVTPTLNFAEDIGSISGTVYVDLNGNGRRDAGEPVAAGIQIAYGESTTSTFASSYPIATDASGNFSFGPLPPPTYGIFVVSSYFDGRHVIATAPYAVTLLPGQNISNVSLGVKLGSV